MAMNHQEFGYTEPTPAEGLAKYLQLFTRGPDLHEFVIRDRDGRTITISIPRGDLKQLYAAIFGALHNK